MEPETATGILNRLTGSALEAEADDDDFARLASALALLFVAAWLVGFSSVLRLLGRLMRRQGTLTEDDLAVILREAERALGPRFEAQTTPQRLDLLELAYEQASRDAVPGVTVQARLGGGQDFSYLERNTAYWVRTYYDRLLSDEITALGDEVLREGLSRFEAGRRFEEAFSARLGQSVDYWERLSNHVTTRTQEFARIRQYERARVGARIEAVRDDRTSELCLFLHGKRIPLKLMQEAREALLSASDPEAVKQVMPWLTVDEARLFVRGDEVTNMALAMAPYHFGCRTRTVADL